MITPTWLLRTAAFTIAVVGGLLLADLTRSAPVSEPFVVSLPAHVLYPRPATPVPTAQPAAAGEFPTVSPAATPAPEATPIATAAPVLTVPLASVPQTLNAGGMELTLIVSPGVAGQNAVELFFFDAAGAWASVTAIEFRLQLLGSPAPPSVVTVEPLHPGHAYVAEAELRHAGVWQVDVRLAGEAVPGVTGSFQFLLP